MLHMYRDVKKQHTLKQTNKQKSQSIHKTHANNKTPSTCMFGEKFRIWTPPQPRFRWFAHLIGIS